MSVRINWASRSSYVTNTEWDRRWDETFRGHSLKKGNKKIIDGDKIKESNKKLDK